MPLRSRDRGQRRSTFYFQKAQRPGHTIKMTFSCVSSPDFYSFFIIMLFYPYHWGWDLQPFFSWHSLSQDSPVSALFVTHGILHVYSLKTFSVTPLLSNLPTVFQSLCQNNPLLIKVMETLATGSDCLTMEEDFKVRFNAQIPITENHKTFSSLSGFELFINR